MDHREEPPAAPVPAEPSDQVSARQPMVVARSVRVVLPAVVFGLVDVWLVHRGGRSLGSSLVAGTVLGVFIAVVLARVERTRAARRQQEGDGPRSGSWSNPSGRQRFFRRLRNHSGRRY